MIYETKPLTAKELSKTISLGIVKGLVYYSIYYIVLFRLVIYYIIPYLIQASGLEGIDISSLVSLELVNIRIILIFIVLSIIGTFLVRHVPYGRALDSLIGLLMLYIVLTIFNFGRSEGYISEYNLYYHVDLSPLFQSILIIIAFITLGHVFISVGREYRGRKTQETRKIHIDQ
ncbi:MAG: hypothetical protein DRO40_05220 [Thermoprotei archaeon]|nr:MAG: hypothetical protein DRO40_05220 [Thermoprotei archaeon]